MLLKYILHNDYHIGLWMYYEKYSKDISFKIFVTFTGKKMNVLMVYWD